MTSSDSRTSSNTAESSIRTPLILPRTARGLSKDSSLLPHNPPRTRESSSSTMNLFNLHHSKVITNFCDLRSDFQNPFQGPGNHFHSVQFSQDKKHRRLNLITDRTSDGWEWELWVRENQSLMSETDRRVTLVQTGRRV